MTTQRGVSEEAEPPPRLEEVAETIVSDVESEPRAADQREQVPASYTDALTAIYKYLPENICPTQPLPPPRVMSLYEADTTPIPLGMNRLPFSPTVGGLVANLEGSLAKVKGWQTSSKARATPTTFKLANAGRKYYVPHNSTWPVKPPPLDVDAGVVGVKGQGYPDKGTAKLLTSLDEGLRSIVAMGSHIDLCLGAARQAGENPDELDSLLQSSARASKHILGTALGLSTDILLVRRDLAASTSSVLPGPGRDALRTAPLGADTLFGGRCLEVSASDLQDRQRRHLAKVPSTSAPRTFGGRGSGYRRPTFKSRGRGRVSTNPSPARAPVAPAPAGPQVSQRQFSSRGASRGRGQRFSSRWPRRGGGGRSGRGVGRSGGVEHLACLRACRRQDCELSTQWEEVTRSKWVLGIIRRGYIIPSGTTTPHCPVIHQCGWQTRTRSRGRL